jgi:hypothetical protein
LTTISTLALGMARTFGALALSEPLPAADADAAATDDAAGAAPGSEDLRLQPTPEARRPTAVAKRGTE